MPKIWNSPNDILKKRRQAEKTLRKQIFKIHKQKKEVMK